MGGPGEALPIAGYSRCDPLRAAAAVVTAAAEWGHHATTGSGAVGGATKPEVARGFTRAETPPSMRGMAGASLGAYFMAGSAAEAAAAAPAERARPRRAAGAGRPTVAFEGRRRWRAVAASVLGVPGGRPPAQPRRLSPSSGRRRSGPVAPMRRGPTTSSSRSIRPVYASTDGDLVSCASRAPDLS